MERGKGDGEKKGRRRGRKRGANAIGTQGKEKGEGRAYVGGEKMRRSSELLERV